MDEVDILEGFTKLTETVRRSVGKSIKDPFVLGVYAHIKMEANWSTGIYHGTALGIAYKFGDTSLERKVQRSMFKLRAAKLINYFCGSGRRGGYDVLVDSFEITLGGWKGQFLDAWKHGRKAQPEYETRAGQGIGNGLETGDTRVEGGGGNGRIQDVPKSSLISSDVSEVMSCKLEAPQFPQSEQKPNDSDNNNDKTKDNSLHHPVEADAEDLEMTTSLWKELYGEGRALEKDFCLLLSDPVVVCRTDTKYCLPIYYVIVWLKFVCNSSDFRTMECSWDFRLEINDVLDRFEKYVSTTTTRKLRDRLEAELAMFRKAHLDTTPDCAVSSSADAIDSDLIPEDDQAF